MIFIASLKECELVLMTKLKCQNVRCADIHCPIITSLKGFSLAINRDIILYECRSEL